MPRAQHLDAVLRDHKRPGVVGECARRGLALKSGHLVPTGVVGRPVPIAPGDRVRADFGVLGDVDLHCAGHAFD